MLLQSPLQCPKAMPARSWRSLLPLFHRYALAAYRYIALQFSSASATMYNQSASNMALSACLKDSTPRLPLISVLDHLSRRCTGELILFSNPSCLNVLEPSFSGNSRTRCTGSVEKPLGLGRTKLRRINSFVIWMTKAARPEKSPMGWR